MGSPSAPCWHHQGHDASITNPIGGAVVFDRQLVAAGDTVAGGCPVNDCIVSMGAMLGRFKAVCD
jgi:hypothetical protein